jgi:hypothetical protein
MCCDGQVYNLFASMDHGMHNIIMLLIVHTMKHCISKCYGKNFMCVHVKYHGVENWTNWFGVISPSY